MQLIKPPTYRIYLVILMISVALLGAGCNLFDSGSFFSFRSDSLATDSTALADSLRFDSLSVAQLPPDSLQNAPTNTQTTEEQVTVSASLLDSLMRELQTLKDQQAKDQQTAVSDLPQDSATASSNDSTLAALPDSLADQATTEDDSTKAASGSGRLTDAVGGIQHLGRNILLSLITLVIFFYLIRGIIWTLERFSEQSATRRLFFKRLVPIVRILTWSLAIYLILIHIFALGERQLISAWTAIGLAVGFASQDILKNIFGGIIIIIDQPFQVGDKINIGGTYGEVTNIGLRSTRIVTPDDNLVSVPNAQVVESQVANANAGALDCQVVIDLYLPGWVDVLSAKAIAYNAAANSNYVYLDKPIVVNIKDEFKETFLTHLVVKAYVIDNRYEFAFASDVTETAKAEFQRKGMLTPLTSVLALNNQVHPDQSHQGQLQNGDAGSSKSHPGTS